MFQRFQDYRPKVLLAVGVMVIPGKARTFRRGRPVRQFPRLVRLGATPKMGALQTSLRAFKVCFSQQ